MKVYRVVGSTGEYEDYHEWTAQTFKDKQEAEMFMSECIKYADKKFKEASKEDDSVYIGSYVEEHNSPDEGFTLDYNGTSYEIEELDVI